MSDPIPAETLEAAGLMIACAVCGLTEADCEGEGWSEHDHPFQPWPLVRHPDRLVALVAERDDLRASREMWVNARMEELSLDYAAIHAERDRLRADLAEAVEALRELVAVRDSDRIDSDLSIDEWVRRLAAFSDRHDAAYDAARAFLARLDGQPTEGAPT